MDDNLQIVDVLDRYAERGARQGPSRVLASAREARELDRHYALGLDLGEWWRLPPLPLELDLEPLPRRGASSRVARVAASATVAVVVLALFAGSASVLLMGTRRPPAERTTPLVRLAANDSVRAARASREQARWDGWVHFADRGPTVTGYEVHDAAVRQDPQPEWPPGALADLATAQSVQGRVVYDEPNGFVIGTHFVDVGFVPKELTDAPGFDVLDLYMVSWGCAPGERSPPLTDVRPAEEQAVLCRLWRQGFLDNRARYLGTGTGIGTNVVTDAGVTPGATATPRAAG